MSYSELAGLGTEPANHLPAQPSTELPGDAIAMKKIEAIIKPFKLDEVKEALQ